MCFLEKNAPPNVLMHAWPLVQKAENDLKTQYFFLEKIAPPNILLHAWPLVKKAENHVFVRNNSSKMHPQCLDACLAPGQAG